MEALGVDVIEAASRHLGRRLPLSAPWRNARKKPRLRAGAVVKDIVAAHEALKVAGDRERIHLWWPRPPSTGNTS
ncbi:MAG: hypothetical protein ACLT8E_05075 [Akkermansia sp.]